MLPSPSFSLLARPARGAALALGASVLLGLLPGAVALAAPAMPSTPRLSAASDSGIQGDNVTNDATPTLTGTAEANVTIKLYNTQYSPGVLVGTGSATSTGAWSITTSQLAGVTRIIAWAYDAAGTQSLAPSGQLILVIMTSPPGAPAAPGLDPASDTAPTGDGATSIGNPVVTGTGADGQWKVTVYADGVQAGVVAPETTGAWRLTLPALALGSHAITAKFTDIADNTGPLSAPFTLSIISTVAPSVPGAPSLNSATAGNGQVALAWSAPASNGGSAISGYTATASPGGASCTSAGTSCTVSGLANGTGYSFTVSAANAVGTGPASNSLSATPTAPASVPGAPGLNSANRGNASVALAWSAPASNGGSAITGYTATASPGGATCTSSGLNCTVGGLANGTSYSFTVTATNAMGPGPASNAMTATPATVPGAPGLNSATAGNGQVSLAWSAPASNGGSAISGYTATASPGGASCTTSGQI